MPLANSVPPESSEPDAGRLPRGLVGRGVLQQEFAIALRVPTLHIFLDEIAASIVLGFSVTAANLNSPRTPPASCRAPSSADSVQITGNS